MKWWREPEDLSFETFSQNWDRLYGGYPYEIWWRNAIQNPTFMLKLHKVLKKT